VDIVNAGFKFSQDSPHIDQPPPSAGEHGESILESLGSTPTSGAKSWRQPPLKRPTAREPMSPDHPPWLLACMVLTFRRRLGRRTQDLAAGEYAVITEPASTVPADSRYVAVRDGTHSPSTSSCPRRPARSPAANYPWSGCTPRTTGAPRNGLTAANYPGKALQLVKYGYAVAVADFRGLYASYGRNAGYNRGEWQDAARFDAYDITEWLARQPWSNGKVGMWGCSATGGSQMQALSTAPPSLKAIFPMSCEWTCTPSWRPAASRRWARQP
jgi:hypothetical protein